MVKWELAFLPHLLILSDMNSSQSRPRHHTGVALGLNTSTLHCSLWYREVIVSTQLSVPQITRLSNNQAEYLSGKKKGGGRARRWQKCIHICNKIDSWLALYWRKKIKVNWKIWFIIDDVSSIGSGWNMSKCFQSCFASYHWWRLQRSCI